MRNGYGQATAITTPAGLGCIAEVPTRVSASTWKTAGDALAGGVLAPTG